jgi:hypothetical protein
MTQQKTAATMIRDLFYWSGVLAAGACFMLALSSNTALGWRLEHARIPSSWLMGLIAIVAFIAAEIFGSEKLSGSRVAATRGVELAPTADVLRHEA